MRAVQRLGFIAFAHLQEQSGNIALYCLRGEPRDQRAGNSAPPFLGDYGKKQQFFFIRAMTA
jgi:hypothetical protein